MKKEKALETIKEFPQEFELDELIEKLLFVDRVEKGLEQVRQGKTVDHEKVMTEIQRWKKLNGQNSQ